MTPESSLKAQARALGFDICSIARADEPWQAGARLEAFVRAGWHGSMLWMERTLERRKAPVALWSQARSAIVAGLNYGPDDNPLHRLQWRKTGNISVYAQGKDYHNIIKKRLETLARTFSGQMGHAVRVFVDTAPLMEKPLAAKAGIGWQGKHTNLVSRQFGSWLFLGVILTDAILVPDTPEEDHCGTCRACLDICPTDAFPAPYQLDARRCISYLTIEHKGSIPPHYRAAIGNRVYGCDDCLAVCPWNKFARTAREASLWQRAELQAPGLDVLANLDDKAFRALFSGSPVKRTGRDRFVRNVLVAIGNTGDCGFVRGSVLPRLDDASPVVRAAAIWALSRLDPARFRYERTVRADMEKDENVRDEWQQAWIREDSTSRNRDTRLV